MNTTRNHLPALGSRTQQRPARQGNSRGNRPGATPSAVRAFGSARRPRRGAAAVEFALVAPVFITVVMGVSEGSRLFDIQNQLALAAREGARLGAIDRTGMLAQGQTTNEKIIDDVQNFLNANGLPGDETTIYIVDPVDSTTPFDLDDEANELELFELRVELPYTAMTSSGGSLGTNFVLSAKVVFRNARATLVQ